MSKAVDRQERIRRQRRRGATWAAIGRQHGMSAARARSIGLSAERGLYKGEACQREEIAEVLAWQKNPFVGAMLTPDRVTALRLTCEAIASAPRSTGSRQLTNTQFADIEDLRIGGVAIPNGARIGSAPKAVVQLDLDDSGQGTIAVTFLDGLVARSRLHRAMARSPARYSPEEKWAAAANNSKHFIRWRDGDIEYRGTGHITSISFGVDDLNDWPICSVVFAPVLLKCFDRNRDYLDLDGTSYLIGSKALEPQRTRFDDSETSES